MMRWVFLILACWPSLAWGQSFLTWSDKSNNEQGFSIERAPSSTTPFARIATVGENIQAYTDPDGVENQCYRLQAFNAAGNSNFSNTACRAAAPQSPSAPGQPTLLWVTVAPPPTGLVLSYNFNAGSGTIISDSSGAGNNGAISGATWTTAGKYDSALSFDGTSSYVSVPDSNSLDLTTQMTLAAWVYPTVVLSGWRTVLVKEGLSGWPYFLFTNSGNNVPAFMVYVSGERILTGGTKPLINTWTHLAATYDGATQRLYINGVQVASRAQTGAALVSTGALKIGGNGSGEYFQGRIDEVKVYNRALSQAEILNAMTTP